MNSGEYVMPKVFLINVDDKKEREKNKFQFISMGRKIQSTTFTNNA